MNLFIHVENEIEIESVGNINLSSFVLSLHPCIIVLLWG